MNERERLEAVLDGDPVDRPPCVCPMQTATKELMASADVRYHEIREDPRKMARLALAANQLAELESARVPFDYSMEVSAFGVASGRVSTQRHPLVLHRAAGTPEDLDRLEVPDPRRSGNVPSVLEAVRLLEERRRDLPIIVGIVSPLMLAFQLRGDHQALLDMSQDPGLLAKLLRKATSFDLEYMRAAFDAGADALVIDDSLSSGDFLSPEQFRAFSEPYLDEVALKCLAYDFESIVHVCGAADNLVERMLAIDTNALSLDQDTDIPSVRARAREAGRRVALMGNLCPTRTLLMMPPSAIASAARRCVMEGVDAVAPGCNLDTFTPTENLLAMVRGVKAFSPPREGGRP